MVHRAFYNSKHLLICLKGKFSARNWSLFLAPLFLLNYFLFNLFLFLQSPPSLCAVPVNTLKGQRVESIVSEKLDKM